MNKKKVLMIAAAVVLLVVDWFTFHDVLEPHSVRDWLTLLASVLVLGYFVI